VARRLLWLAAIVVLLAATGSYWLPAFSHPLIHNEGPAKADIAVVLAGDSYGRRIQFAASLVRDGFVPAVLVSGPRMFGVHESDLAIAMAVRQGNPAEWFFPFPHSALSTRQEAEVIVPELRRRNIHSFLLVTSDFHTRRAARIFRKAAKDIQMRVVASPDEYFHADSWWQTREGQKTVLIEWMKTVATAVGM
jgi:uncharacterized SAM-binding protein YcdF (DUF218 family)